MSRPLPVTGDDRDPALNGNTLAQMYLWSSVMRDRAVFGSPELYFSSLTPSQIETLNAYADFNPEKIAELAALGEVALDLNPSEVTFTPRESRTTEFKTNGGNRFLHWIGPDGRSEDLFSLVGKGSTGVIKVPPLLSQFDGAKGLVPGQGVLLKQTYARAAANARARYLNWMSLLLLSVEQKVIPGTNIDNEISLTCSHQGFSAGYLGDEMSLIEHGPVTFYGHFARPLSFTDSGQSPFAMEYQFEFIVHRFTALNSGDNVSGFDFLQTRTARALLSAVGNYG